MGLFNGDVIIKTTIEMALEDIRKNSWLLSDIMGQFTQEATINQVYGQKEIDRFKEWFVNNRIQVNLQHRLDKDEFPCITIALGNSSEIGDMKHMSDLSTDVETLMPAEIKKPISYIVKPFTPVGYDSLTGAVSVPKSTRIKTVTAGMILVNTQNGNGYVIKEVVGQDILIEPDLDLNATTMAVVPQFPIYKARREHTFFQEQYSIGCHAVGDPNQTIWLHSIVVYILLRYREALLEGRGFTQSEFASSDLGPNPNFGPMGSDNVYSRYITLTGMVQNSWIKAPKRIIEAIDLVDRSGDLLKTGIKILSNLDATPDLDTEDDLWTTSDGEEE